MLMESLLRVCFSNGKDFFRGDNTVMFENLPTYMVNQVKVYDRLGENSRFLGQEVAGDKKIRDGCSTEKAITTLDG